MIAKHYPRNCESQNLRDPLAMLPVNRVADNFSQRVSEMSMKRKWGVKVSQTLRKALVLCIIACSIDR